MAEHAELVKEMIENEKLSSQKRLELARKRRIQQLKKYHEQEKKHDKQEKAANKRKSKSNSVIITAKLEVPKKKRINFDDGVKLLEAAARNDIDEVRELLERGVNPDVANEDGLTALHQCCIDDSEEMLILLLNHGASVNARDSELWTPLHAASTCGHMEICKHLVERRANLLAVNADGNMPYDICDDESTLEYLETQMANQGVTQELIDETRLSTEKTMLNDIKEYEQEGNSLASWKDRTGASLLHLSAANGYYDVTEYLLNKRIDVNAKDNDGWTAAMAAAFWAQIQVLELLAKHGADLELKNKDNKSLLELVDDVEIKEQIEEIKKETETNLQKFKRVNSDIRRRSSNNIRSLNVTGSSIYSSNTSLSDKNPFSSSVRRHSMREKQRMSQKEARDEAKFRISISTDDISDDASSPRSPPADTSMPVTNIDDIALSVTDNHVTTITITSPGSTEKVLHDSTTPTEVKTNGDAAPPEPSKRISATIKITDDDSNEPAENTPPSVLTNGGNSVNQTETNHNVVDPVKPIDTDTSKLETVGPLSDTSTPKNEKTDTVDGVRTNSKFDGSANVNHSSGDIPMKRYSALNQPAIGEEGKSEKQKCCVIL